MNKKYIIKNSTKIKEKEIIKLYESGVPTNKIGKTLLLSHTTVTKILRMNNIHIRTKAESAEKKYNVNMIISLYENNVSSTTIAEKSGLSTSAIMKILRRHKIRIKTNSQSKRKYKIDEHFFDEIDTEEKAYFLGFLFADGHNNEKNGRVVLALAQKDLDTLEKLNSLIYENKNLYLYDTKDGFKKCVLLISSRHMSETLSKKYGCIQHKTSNLKFPNLDKKFFIPFIRGYFDGDGGISQNKKQNGTVRFSISIVSTKPFLMKLKEIIESMIDINLFFEKKSCSKDEKVFRINISGNQQILKFIQLIYNNSTIHMNRKFHFIEKIKNNNQLIIDKKCSIIDCNKTPRSNNLCWSHLIQEKRITNPNYFNNNKFNILKAIAMHEEGYTQIKIAKEFNVTPSAICMAFKKFNIK